MHRFVRSYDPRLSVSEAEQISRITVVFNLVALAFLAIFAAMAFKTGDTRYGITLIEVMALSICNVALFLVTGRMQMLVAMTCIGYLPFCAFLQITGGQNNSGILWHYVYPITVYYIAGLRSGSIYASLLIVMEAILMFVDNQPFFLAKYPFEFKTRFLATMVVMSIIGAMLEHSRRSAQNKLLELADKLEKASETDDLTGLPNRRALRKRLEDEVLRIGRTGGDFAMILCDIDHFKFINDSYGHATGDEALRHLARLFLETVRKYDLVARWGGEEFLVVLPEASLAHGLLVAERIRAAVETHPLHSQFGETVQLTISGGVCSWREFSNLDELFWVADYRLYKAKSDGRNRVVGQDTEPPPQP